MAGKKIFTDHEYQTSAHLVTPKVHSVANISSHAGVLGQLAASGNNLYFHDGSNWFSLIESNYAGALTGRPNFDPASGNIPFTVGSGHTAKVDNLNADLLDGYDTSTSAVASKIPVYGTSGVLKVGTPSDDLDAANKLYVDSAIEGLDIKASVAAASTGNLTLSGTQTIDGTSITAGMRVLVKDQSTGSQNGIYICQSGSWALAEDSDSGSLSEGAYVFVEAGTVNNNTGWTYTDSASYTWAQFSGAGQLNAGDGLVKSGDTLSANVASPISIVSDQITIADGAITGAKLANNTVTSTQLADSIQVSNIGVGIAPTTAPLVLRNSNDPNIVLGYPTGSNEHRISWDSSKLYFSADHQNNVGSSGMFFKVDGSVALQIESDQDAYFWQKLGIGVSPSHRLHIKDDADTGNGGIAIERSSTGDKGFLNMRGGRLGLVTETALPIKFYTNDTSRLEIDGSTGDVKVISKLGVNTSPISLATATVNGTLQAKFGHFTGWAGNGDTGTGLGVDVGVSGGKGYVMAYNRTSSSYGDLRFVAAGGNTGLTLLSASGDVGCNTITPSTKFHIYDSTSNTTNAARTSVIDTLTVETHNTGNTPYSGFGQGIVFRGVTYNNTSTRTLGRIAHVIRDHSEATTGTALRFQTQDNSSTTDAPVTQMEVGTDVEITNKLGIGVSPDTALDIQGNNNISSRIKITNTAPSTNNVWNIHANYSDQTLQFMGDSTLALKLDDSGQVTLGNLPTSTTDTNVIVESSGLLKKRALNNVAFAGFGSGTVGKIPIWSGSTTTLGDSVITQNNGKVGINTASPDVKLEVIDASPTDGIIADFVNSTSAAGTVAAIKLSNADSEACDVVLGANRVAANYGSDFFISLSDSVDGTNRERFRITEAGNVGINATSPTGKLQIGDNYTINASYGGDDIYIKGAANKASYDPNVYNTDDIGALITISDSDTVGPTKPGLVLYNDDVTAGGFSPMLLFSKRETGNSPYKATMAGIYARSPLGSGDNNGWIDGELIFATAGAASHGVKQRMVINKEGLVGIGTTSPNDKLEIYGNMRVRGSDGFGANTTASYNPSYVAYPGGGKAGSSSSSQAGYIKITLPQSWTNTMMQFSVDVFEYGDNKTKTFKIAGYNYSPNSNWHQASATVLAGNDSTTYRVEFGHDGSKCAIYISKGTDGASSSWVYPFIVVRDASFSFNNIGISNWIDGWDVSFSTATLSGITQTRDVQTQVTGSGTSQYIPRWNSTGTALNDSVIAQNSSNIGIGTDDPDQKLEVSGNQRISSNGLLEFFGGTIYPQISRNTASGGLIIDTAGGVSNSVPLLSVRENGGTDFVTVLGSGNVGINCTPDTKLHIADSGEALLRLERTATGLGTNSGVGSIEFKSNDASTNGTGVVSKIQCKALNSYGNLFGLAFSTGHGGSLTEKMVLDNDGRLHVKSSSATGANFILETTNSGGIPLLDLKGAHSAQLRYKDELDVIQGRIDFGDSGTFNFIDVPNNKSTLYLETGGNVGIGSVDPDSGLTISKSQTSAHTYTTNHLHLATPTTSNNGGATTISFATSTSDNYGWSLSAIRETTNGNNTRFAFKSHNNSDSGSEVLSVLAEGSVGIGIDDPKRLVTLYKATSPVLQLVNSSTGATASDGFLLTQSGLDSYLENGESGSMFFRTSATNRLEITSSGHATFSGTITSTDNANGSGDNIVVSTTNKDAGLYAISSKRSGTTVGGMRIDGRFRATSGSSASPSYSFTDDSNTGMFRAGADHLQLISGGNGKLKVAGHVSVIGATDLLVEGANRRLSFTSGTGTVRTTTAADLYLATNSTNRVQVTSGGAVKATRDGGSNLIQVARIHDGSLTGNGTATSFTITHNLETGKPIAVVIDDSSGAYVEAQIVVDSDNAIIVTFNNPPTSGKVYRVPVTG